MSRVGLGAAWRQGSEQGLEAEFEIAACIARNVIPRVNPPVYCVQDSRYGPTIPANSICTL